MATVLVMYNFIDGEKLQFKRRLAVPLAKNKDGGMDLHVFYHPSDGMGHIGGDHVELNVQKGGGNKQYQDITSEAIANLDAVAMEVKPNVVEIKPAPEGVVS